MAASVFLEIKSGKIGNPGYYNNLTDEGGMDNSIQIIQFDAGIFEAKMNVKLKGTNGHRYDLKNGYIKAHL